MKSEERIKSNITRLKQVREYYLDEAIPVMGKEEFGRVMHRAGVCADIIGALRWVLEDGDEDIVL